MRVLVAPEGTSATDPNELIFWRDAAYTPSAQIDVEQSGRRSPIFDATLPVILELSVLSPGALWQVSVGFPDSIRDSFVAAALKR